MLPKQSAIGRRCSDDLRDASTGGYTRTHSPQLRRFTRLALGFSKSLDNLKAAVVTYVAWYNFCRVHRTLRVAPVMEAGLTDHIWTVKGLLNAGANA